MSWPNFGGLGFDRLSFRSSKARENDLLIRDPRTESLLTLKSLKTSSREDLTFTELSLEKNSLVRLNNVEICTCHKRQKQEVTHIK